MRNRSSDAALEAGLRRVLAPEPAPEHLTASVMKGVRRADHVHRERRTAPRRGWTWALAAAACLLLLLFHGPWSERYERRIQGLAPNGDERALIETLVLVGSKWNEAQAAAFAPRREALDD